MLNRSPRTPARDPGRKNHVSNKPTWGQTVEYDEDDIEPTETTAPKRDDDADDGSGSGGG